MPVASTPLSGQQPAQTDAASSMPEALLKALQSRTFEKTPALRKLLLYLWEHSQENIGEYAIAVEALGRGARFDPRTDATVRVQISRLRRRLQAFYETEGAASTTKVDIPLGTHEVHILEAPLNAREAPATQEPDQLQEVQKSYPAWLIPILCCTIALLAIFCAWLAWRQSSFGPLKESAGGPLPKLWRDFLSNRRPARIVIPTPVFLSWGGGFKARDANVNDFPHWKDSPQLMSLAERLGQPVLSQDYTVASDTFAALRLARYFDLHGIHAQVSSSAESPVETSEHENLILLGTQGTLSPFQSYLSQLDFQFAAHRSYIQDSHPAPGSSARFESIRESGSRTISPAIVASLPSGVSDTTVFVIAGYHTTAIVSYLTSPAGLGALAKAQSEHGNAKYFEAVVVPEVNDTTSLKTSLAAFKKHRAQ